MNIFVQLLLSICLAYVDERMALDNLLSSF